MDINEIATKQDIQKLYDFVDSLKAEIKRIDEQQQTICFSINELSRMKIIGGRDKIKTLIKKGLLKTTDDGRISQYALNEYYKTK